MKTIAIVTGATGGIGRAFVEELKKEKSDEIWVVGRSEEKLMELKKDFGDSIVPLQADLAGMQGLTIIKEKLRQEKPVVSYLVNNAGIAAMKRSEEFTDLELERTIDLNCKAVAVLINHCLPFMKKGSKILNLSSASSFQPVPYINLYAATKAFERSYSRALNVELKPLGITVTAVCPSWVDTSMLEKEMNGKPIKFPGLTTPEKVASTAMKDAKKGKDMSICSFYVKCQHLNVKLMPQKLSMKLWMKGIKKYL